MAWTKRNAITDAYSELGMADYAFDLEPEQLQTALRKLDAMMATWMGRGVRIGYAGGDGQGKIDVAMATPAWAQEAIVTNLAIVLAPSVGKTVAPSTMMAAGKSMRVVEGKTATPMVRQISGYGGAGNYGSNIVRTPENIAVGTDGYLEF